VTEELSIKQNKNQSTLIEIKHRDTGAVIFSSNKEGNTFAKALRLALILGIDIRHADISNQDLSHGYFAGANFNYCDLRGAIMTGGNFFHARFDRANLSKVTAHNANFMWAVMHNTCAQQADFTGSKLNNAVSMEGDFSKSNFTNADLSGFATRGANLKDIVTDGAILYETNTRIGYKWPRQKVPCVCDGPCQNCVGCESPKKQFALKHKSMSRLFTEYAMGEVG
jgi:uncharacterized protein YjbI with pentapeptide repeats